MDPAARTGIGSGAGVVDPSAGAGAAAGKVPMAAAAAPPGAVVLALVAAATSAGAAAAAKPALNWKNLRRRWAQALFVLGCAAAALAIFSINTSSPTAESHRLLGGCAPADADAAALHDASEMLLVVAAVQVLAATAAQLVPASRQVAVFLNCMGWETGFRAARVLLRLFECRGGRVDAVVGTYYFILQVVVMVGSFVGSVIVKNSGY